MLVRVPWLPLSERGRSEVLDQLLTQKEGGALESGPLWVLFLSLRLGVLWFSSRALGGGQSAKLPPHSPHVSICGNSWEGLGPGIIRGPMVLEMRESEK